MMKSKIRNIHRFELENKLKEKLKEIEKYQVKKNNKESDIDKAEILLDIIFGTTDDAYWGAESKYVVKHRYGNRDKSTVFNRINSLWVYPLFILIIAPLRWVMMGDHSVSEDSRLGKILIKIIGPLK